MPKVHDDPRCVLGETQVERFIQDGFVRLDRAFPGALADLCRTRLWRDIPCDPHDYGTLRVKVTSRGRALLLLFLFSDVGEKDAPTRIRVGSHLEVARRLEPAGAAGMTKLELDLTGDWPQALATGEAGTVYLCHPFIIHAAQRHRGSTPRFLAQPPLAPAEPFRLVRADSAYSPVERAIRLGLRESQPQLHTSGDGCGNVG